MRTTLKTTTISLLMLGAMACGASNEAATPGEAAMASSSGSEAHEHGGHHRHRFPAGPVTDFHAVLRPLWHSEPGADRDARTCTEAGSLHTHAAAIVAAPVPEAAQAHESDYRAAAAVLNREVETLPAACAGQSGVAERLEAVHTAFHRLIETFESHH
jgi:hypothetical protein